MKLKNIPIVAFLLPCVALTSCFFTGVESTGRITDKEVERTLSEMEQRQPTSSLKPYASTLLSWQRGKAFYVADDQAKLLFEPSPLFDRDTLRLAGKVLTFIGYDQQQSLTGEKTVAINLSDNTHTLVYRTGKKIEDFAAGYNIPLLIDMDEVEHYAHQLVGKRVYVTTPLWYDQTNGQPTAGRQYIPVTITSVQPGNKSLPLKVVFRDEGKGTVAFVWMSTPGSVMRSREFDAMFSLRNPRDNYPNISDERWNQIVLQQVSNGMTKEECRLAKGSPRQVSPVPDQNGMKEFWYYDGGEVLYFEDGLLQNTRKR